MTRSRDLNSLKPRTPVLAINTYGGSLLIAAKRLMHPIVGSFEDVGYGVKLQRANFPDVDIRPKLKDWPIKPDLTKLMVIAHPPCSSFSRMTKSKGEMLHGLLAEKFKCTQRVLDYALGNQAKALAVESVVEAAVGAAEVHEAAAQKHGYHIYRILQNACTFGVPQWRPRFWCIFVRKNLSKSFIIEHRPKVTTISDILEPVPTRACKTLSKKLIEQRLRLADDFGPVEAQKIFVDRAYGTGILGAVIRRYHHEKLLDDSATTNDCNRRHVVFGSFHSCTPRILDPHGLAPTLLHHSFLTINGRLLSLVEHKRLMGFPDDYAVPESLEPRLRDYLSRGVCPPVAMWVIEMIDRNLNRITDFYKPRTKKLLDHAIELKPGQTADLRPSRAMWDEVLNGDL